MDALVHENFEPLFDEVLSSIEVVAKVFLDCGKRRSGIFCAPFGEVDERFKSHAWKACLGL
jgi:hypothetical protein